ncbi:PH domain-containing protein [Macrococcus brunensis]|uniref:PH domain-containing protein n=1 Tax=Macrococcus brunensis TaxID=198483 RepID=UPI001EF09F1E|nr:PH domain-containing protein [Macrococcus brunensis]ULG71129.1 PH domain-containing protein [Macrococcus brunensis]ULG73464.1 PH domain-containing protein [Macrococcus brunensis]
MKFQSQGNPLFYGITVILISMLVFYYFISSFLMFIFTFLLTTLLIVMLLREYYIISRLLTVHRGISRIQIDIMQIEVLNIAVYGSRIGVEICSKGTDQIVVFPVETERFVKLLLKRNPKIYLQNQQNMDAVRCNL